MDPRTPLDFTIRAPGKRTGSYSLNLGRFWIQEPPTCYDWVPREPGGILFAKSREVLDPRTPLDFTIRRQGSRRDPIRKIWEGFGSQNPPKFYNQGARKAGGILLAKSGKVLDPRILVSGLKDWQDQEGDRS